MIDSHDDWRAREDADTLRRCGEIKSDPVRYERAKQVALENVTSILSSIGNSAPPVKTRGRRNPATIQRL